MATRHIKKGEVVVSIPTPAIRSRHTLPEALIAKLPANMTLHGLLAADLLLHPPDARAGNSPDGKVWAKLVPSLADFESSTPFFWPEKLQRLLPPEATNLLRNQQARFEQDWSHFRKTFPDANEREYLYSWFLVNTRSFYYEIHETLGYPWHDRLALLPVADVFNHANVGCLVAFSTEVYDITADRDYREGEEVYTSYGAHSNDFLLAEYGFMLPNNPSDRVCLDSILLAKLQTEQKAALFERGLLGDFMLRIDSPRSHKTWIALRMLVSDAEPQWDDWVNGQEDAHGTLAKALAMLPDLLIEFRREIEKRRRSITALRDEGDVTESIAAEVLLERWRRIGMLVERFGQVAKQRMKNGNGNNS